LNAGDEGVAAAPSIPRNPAMNGWPTRESRFIHRSGYLYWSGYQQNPVDVWKLFTFYLAICPIFVKVTAASVVVFAVSAVCGVVIA